ncbi:MAG: hypothetical protein ACK55I_37900, partial [bacterium]
MPLVAAAPPRPRTAPSAQPCCFLRQRPKSGDFCLFARILGLRGHSRPTCGTRGGVASSRSRASCHRRFRLAAWRSVHHAEPRTPTDPMKPTFLASAFAALCLAPAAFAQHVKVNSLGVQ